MAKEINVKGPVISSDSKWIYDWLGWNSCCPADIEKGLEEAGGEEVVLEISSYGGIVVSGFEIYKLLKEYKGKVTAHVISAMSAATVIACGADEVLMSDAALFMIHNTSTRADGDYRDMEMAAESLREFNQGIIDVYVKKTGLSEEKLQELMDRDTYMSSKKAIELGFADGYIFGKEEDGGGEEDFSPAMVLNAGIPVIPEKKANELRMALNAAALGELPAGQTGGQPGKEEENGSDADSSINENKGKEGNESMTLEEFLKENPEGQAAVDQMAAAARKEGADSERNRLKELDAIAASVSEEKLRDAKYGKNAMNAMELAHAVLLEDAKKSKNYMEEAVKDSEESGVDDVKASPEEGDTTDESDVMASFVNKKRGGK